MVDGNRLARSKLSAATASSTYAVVYNPYDPKGGAGIIQDKFAAILRATICSGCRLVILSTADGTSRLRLYIGRLWKTCKARNTIGGASFVICQGVFDPGSLLVGFIARTLRVPYWVVPRGDFVPTVETWRITRNSSVKWWIWRTFGVEHVNGSNCTIVTSRLEGVRLIQAGADPAKILVIPDPVGDAAKVPRANIPCENSSPGDGGREPYVLWLGRFAREKNLMFLLNVWRSVLHEVPNRKLVLAGSVYDSREFEKLLKRIRLLRLEKQVEVLDWVSGKEKEALLANARCLVLPSRYESFGLVVIEALTRGTPVVVSDETPWETLRQPVGVCVELDVAKWVAALLPYVGPDRKVSLAPEIVSELLTPFTESNVTAAWRRASEMWNRGLVPGRRHHL